MTPIMIHTAVKGMSNEKIDLKLPFNFTISCVHTPLMEVAFGLSGHFHSSELILHLLHFT
jgi:hypothetical protein